MEVNSKIDIKNVNKILYIGSDEGFYQNIQTSLATYIPALKVEYDSFFSIDDKEIQSLILRLREDKPKVVLVDFSVKDRALLHLIRVWMRQGFYSKINFIGFVDQKQFESITPRAIMAAMPCIHIKSSDELDSVLHDILCLGFPGQVKEHGFATAKMNDAFKAYYPCKASIISSGYIHLESNVKLKPKEVREIKCHWTNKRIINSKLCMLGAQSQSDLYYNYQYSQKLLFVHADPVKKDPEQSDACHEDRLSRRQEIMSESQHKLNKWLKENQIDSSPKFIKALVVDKAGHFFNNRALTDSFSFVLRNQPFLEHPYAELKKTMPKLIIYNIEDVDDTELSVNADISYTYNDLRSFQKFVKDVKSLYPKAEDQPFIIIFNSPYLDTKQIQMNFNYQNILAIQEELNPDLVVQLAEKLKVKLAASTSKPKQGEVFINKVSELSYAEMATSITFLACSENDIYFDAEEVIPDYTTLKISEPVPMYITVLPKPSFATVESKYYAIIHGISDDDKKELRRYINGIFFRELDLEKEADADEMEKIKAAYIKKKQDEEKALLEKKKAQDAKEKADKAEKEE